LTIVEGRCSSHEIPGRLNCGSLVIKGHPRNESTEAGISLIELFVCPDFVFENFNGLLQAIYQFGMRIVLKDFGQ
jgi:hypothetical protein